jgi:chloramphenicol O-acetyltransferase type B
MKLIKKFLFRQAERRLRKIPGIYRGQARFQLHYPEKYKFGIGSYGLPKIHDWNEGSTLTIGAFCSIAANVEIFLGGHHHLHWLTTYPFPTMLAKEPPVPQYGFSRGDVVIGSDVWLCSNCMILSGVTIGHGAVVAAGAVVTQNVAPYSVVAGNPAKHIKWRFDETERNTLLDIAWWEWSIDEIASVTPLLCSGNSEIRHATKATNRTRTRTDRHRWKYT